MGKGLDLLAKKLTPDQVAAEAELHAELWRVIWTPKGARERLRKVIRGFKELYRSQRGFSKFIRIVKLAHRTAYDMLEGPKRANGSNRADSAQSAGKNEKQESNLDYKAKVMKAVADVRLIFEGLRYEQWRSAVDELYSHLVSEPPDKPVDNPPSEKAQGTVNELELVGAR